MKIGIIGASGTLGRVAVAVLLESGVARSVSALIRRPDPELDELAGCSTVLGGIFDASALELFVRECDVVVNLAARNPEGQEKDLESVEDFFALNGLGAAMVASVVQRMGKPLVHFSTAAVYEAGEYEEARFLEENEPLPAMGAEIDGYFDSAVAHCVEQAKRADGGDPLPPESTLTEFPQRAPVYGLTKLIGEAAVLRISDYVCCIRMCDVYGPGHESRGVVTDHLGALRQQGRVDVDFDFRSTVSFIYINDVVTFIGLLATRMNGRREVPEVVNLAGGPVTESEFAGLLETVLDSGEDGKQVAMSKPLDVRYDRRYSTAVLQEAFPDLALTPLLDGVRETWSSS